MAEQTVSIERYEDLIQNRFQLLLSKLQNYAIRIDQNSLTPRDTAPIVNEGSHQALTTLLLSLRRCVYELSATLSHPLLASRDTLYDLWASFQTLLEIDNTLNHIIALTTAPVLTSMGPIHVPNHENASITMELSASQQEKFLQVFNELGRHLCLYYIRLPISEAKNDVEIASTLRSNVQHLGQCIDEAIEQFSRIDTRAYKSWWHAMANEMEETLRQPVQTLDQEASGPEAEKVQHLCRESIPIVKLTRLLLNKMSRPTNSEVHPISLMEPRNLIALTHSTRMLAIDLHDFVESIHIFDPHPDLFNQEPVENIEEAVEETLQIINGFLEEYSDPNDENFSNRWRDWYERWRDAFDLAVERFQTTLVAINS
ncbi:hypothetical protein PGTUg99_027990 [Puccinia graminis f. sp. tritici]|uniref:Uncharacterized protein n=2 Tax=Puccinia graminis f. sp. tritici TaxID=56615 RepID=E3JZ26_PUCGT|nr:uncharacterized protein PGTG_03257 [Puccinia graminis f. sp. tritici CRL 75-36-700-3]EFP77301.1 hypothetical protein PGTG_03257 [Puccinia graminis f. sp. tritici CRL 75-36-700-3]KAA1124348.1 hypothetical protein PGTUg99_027990 [Puccinia graminis f. sp. tritici]